MRTISNEEYEAALGNQDNIKIINSAVKQFYIKLSYDERHQCKLVGLWNALKNFSGNKKTKFTTYLYYRVWYECLTCMREKFNQQSFSLLKDVKTTTDSHLEFLDAKWLLDKALGKLTNKQICIKYNISKYMLNKKIKLLQEFIKNGV